MNLKNKNILVSIIIPAFNRKKTIARAIESCLTQTYNNIEIIICDDHSTDGTLDFVKSNYSCFPNVKCYITPNDKKGANVARNEGIKKANGEVIAFLDSDDFLLKDSIETRLNVLINNKCGLVYGDVYFCSPNNCNWKKIRFDDISKFVQKKYLVQELSLCVTSSIMVRKSVMEKIGYLNENLRSWQDDDMVVSIGMKYRLLHCKREVAVIVSTPGSIVSNRNNIYQGCSEIVKKHKKEIIQYSSFMRYCIWKIRLITLYAKCKEQSSKKKEIYRLTYHILDRIIVKLYRHIYV